MGLARGFPKVDAARFIEAMEGKKGHQASFDFSRRVICRCVFARGYLYASSRPNPASP
jgi:hypothetical protein